MFKEKTLVQLIVFVAAATFYMPLIFVPESFIFPFIVPKIIFFRSLVLVLLGLYALLLKLDFDRYRPKMNMLNTVVFGFWLSFAISTFVGVDWYRSLWDNHERMLGLFTVTHYVLFFVVLSNTIRSKAQWQLLMRVFLGFASVVMLKGVAQEIWPEYLLNRGAERHASSLGNAIYLSGYGLFLLCFGVLQFFQTKKNDLLWQVYSIAAALLGLWGIFLGGTRGTLLGLIAAIGLVLILVVVLNKNKTFRLGAAALILLGIGALMGSWTFKDSAVVESITPLRRLVNINFDTLENNTRVMAWNMAWDSYLEKPVFGWGPNNFYYAFNQNYDPRFLRHGYGETWFDNAHNIIMNTFATQGTFGIVTYMMLFIIVGLLLFKARKKGAITDAEFGILLAFFVGHFVHNVFVFENPTSYLYFFFALAYVGARVYKEGTVSAGRNIIQTPPVIIMVVVVLFSIGVFNWQPAKANTATLKTIQALYRGAGVAEYAEATKNKSPHIDDVRNDFSRTTTQVVPQLIEAGRAELATELLNIATEELEKNLLLHPNDIRIHLLLSQVYQQRAAVEQNPVYIASAIEVLKQAQTLSPKRQQLMFSLGSFYTMVGEKDLAEEQFILANEVDKSVRQGWQQLKQFYATNGESEKLEAVVAEAKEFGFEI